MTMKKWMIRTVSASILASSVFTMPLARAAEEAITVNAKAAFMIDNETNKILVNQNGDEPLGIASMTKMMSVYMILDAINKGELAWDTPIPISNYAYSISQDYELSNVPLRQDFTYTTKDLYEAMLIYSANGASIAMAEYIGGTEPAFVDMMKAKLDEWGVKDYALYNSTGLENTYANDFGQLYEGAPLDKENQMTARGVATVADHLLDEYPEVLETTKLTTKVFMPESGDEIAMSTYNYMLLEDSGYYRAGVDGLKTGTTPASGASFTGTTVQDEMRVITVVIGAEDNDARFNETNRLMDYAYGNFEKVQLATQGDPVGDGETIEIAKGKEDSVALEYASDLSVITPINEDRTVSSELTLTKELLNEEGLIEAPIEAGTEVGSVHLKIEGDDLGYLDNKTNEVPVAVSTTVEKANIFVLGWRAVATFVSNAWNSVTDFVSGFFN